MGGIFRYLCKKIMVYQKTTENPVEFILRTQYNQGKIAIKQFKNKCFNEVESQRSNRGAQQTIACLLEKDFPGFKDHYPIQNWKQKSKNGNRTYSDVIVTKTFEDSLNVYSKGITSAVKKYGRKSNKKLNLKLEEQLNLEPFVESQPKVSNNMSSTVAGIIALADKGVKSVKTPDGWEVQF